MTSDSDTSNTAVDASAAEPAAPLPAITLSGGLDRGELDALIPGGLYVLTPVSPPARFPLWANLLRTAVAAGRTCHVLVKTDPSEFLERLQASGWTQAHAAWMDENLRLYKMADTFAKILFRLDVEGLTTELAHWGVQHQHVLLVDAADELLSLHDLSLATPQAVKLKSWARGAQVSVLLNFNMANSPTISNGLTGLMDHFSGVARLRSESDGPLLVLEYWQSPTGTVAERGLPLEIVPEGYRLRSGQVRRIERSDSRLNLPLAVGPVVDAVEVEAPPAPDCFTLDQVWARELQLLMGSPWKAAASMVDLRAQAASAAHAVVLLRFGPDSDLADMARDVHALRKALGSRMRLVVAELRASLRYANELMLLRLGVDAVIRRDVPMERWPALLMNGIMGATTRPAQDIDVVSALASAASSHARGYLQVPEFLTEVHAALGRGQVLGVPVALAVLYPHASHRLVDAVREAECRRPGDILTTDGERLHVFFYACSITKGPRVLDSVFHGRLYDVVSSVEWMASEADIEQVLRQLQRHHDQHPMDWMAAQEAPTPSSLLDDTSDLSEPVLARLEVISDGPLVLNDAPALPPPADPPLTTAGEAALLEHPQASPDVEPMVEPTVTLPVPTPAEESTEPLPAPDLEKPRLRSLGEALMGRPRPSPAPPESVPAWSTEGEPVAPLAPDLASDLAPDLASDLAAHVTEPQERTETTASESPEKSPETPPLPPPWSEAGGDSDSDGDASEPLHCTAPDIEHPHHLSSPPMAVEVEALASTQDPSESDADAQAERTKKMTAYRVSEVGPFSPPELDLFGNQTGEPEKEPEDSFTALPEVAEIIRRLAHPPTSTGKKLPADKRNGH